MGNNAIDKRYIKQGLPILCKILGKEEPWFALGILRRIVNNPEEEYAKILTRAKIMPDLIKILLLFYLFWHLLKWLGLREPLYM